MTRDTLPTLLLRNSEQWGARPAVRLKRRGIWHTTTWREFCSDVAAIAAGLERRGLKQGDRVALLGDSRPQLLVTMYAVGAVGAVAAPLYPDATPEELKGWLETIEPTVLFAQDQEQVDKALAVLADFPSVHTILFDDDKGMRHYRRDELVKYAALLEGADGAAADFERMARSVAPGNPAFVFMSSGAAGPAKGVIHTHEAMVSRAKAVASLEGISQEEVVMALLPPGWICQTMFGAVMPLVTGGCVCFPESSDTLLADLREIAPTTFLATPRMLDIIETQLTVRIEEAGGVNLALYRRALRNALRRLDKGGKGGLGSAVYDALLYGPIRDALGMSRIRAAYTAGDAIDPAMLNYYRAFGINMKQVYGSTETGYIDTIQRDGEVKPDTVGRPVDGVELKVGDGGEVWIRSPALFTGYAGDPEGRASVVGADGWFATGDIGALGVNGELSIVDRKADVGTLSDGTPFVPRALENLLRFSPHIKEAVVVGRDRDTICALIDIATGAVAQWADHQGIAYAGHADLAAQEAVYGLVGEWVAKVNADLARANPAPSRQIRRFVLLPEELSADNGLLTRTGRPRRAAIQARYERLIADLYGEGADVAFASSAHEQDAKPATLRIHDMHAVTDVKVERVA